MLVRLVGVGLLGIRPHDDPPVEDRAGRAVEHTLEQLLARAARDRVVDRDVVIDVLAAVRDVQAGDGGAAALALEPHGERRAGEPRAERRLAGRERAVALEGGVDGRHVKGRGALFLEHVVVEGGAGAYRQLGHRVHEARLVREPEVPLEDGETAVRFGDDEDPRLSQHAGGGGQQHDLDRCVDHRLHGHVQERAVLDEGGAERGEDVGVPARMPRQMALDELAVGGHRLGEARQPRTAGQALSRRMLGRESPVHEHQPRPRARADGRAIHQLGGQIARSARAGGVKRRRRQRAEVRVAPVLVTRRREAPLGEPGHGLAAQGRQPCG